MYGYGYDLGYDGAAGLDGPARRARGAAGLRALSERLRPAREGSHPWPTMGYEPGPPPAPDVATTVSELRRHLADLLPGRTREQDSAFAELNLPTGLGYHHGRFVAGGFDPQTRLRLADAIAGLARRYDPAGDGASALLDEVRRAARAGLTRLGALGLREALSQIARSWSGAAPVGLAMQAPPSPERDLGLLRARGGLGAAESAALERVVRDGDRVDAGTLQTAITAVERLAAPGVPATHPWMGPARESWQGRYDPY